MYDPSIDFNFVLKLKENVTLTDNHLKKPILKFVVNGQHSTPTMVKLVDNWLAEWNKNEIGIFCNNTCIQYEMYSYLSMERYETIIILYGWFDPENYTHFLLKYNNLYYKECAYF